MKKIKMKKFPFFGIAVAILFIILGTNLITRQDQFSVVIGYVTIVFFSGLIILAVIKLLSKRNKT